MNESEQKEATFEEALARLEKIVAEMETGALTLEQSMAHFEEGVVLSRLCSQKLEATEKRIEVLMRKSNTETEWAPMPADEPGTASPPPEF